VIDNANLPLRFGRIRGLDQRPDLVMPMRAFDEPPLADLFRLLDEAAYTKASSACCPRGLESNYFTNKL